MIPNDKITAIMERLLEKSKANQIQWTQTSSGDYGEEDEFKVVFGKSYLTISYVSPRSDPDYIDVNIFNNEHDRVGSATFEDLSRHWSLALELFQDASRCVLKWDQVLEEIQEYLDPPSL